MNITKEKIISLQQNEILVFGSNLAGRHGLGLAKEAVKYGAKYGKGVGISGQTYALPTKDKNIQTLPLVEIGKYVDELFNVIKNTPHSHFLITKVGCGLAGYKTEQIKPLFKNFLILENISLPQEFI